MFKEQEAVLKRQPLVYLYTSWLAKEFHAFCPFGFLNQLKRDIMRPEIQKLILKLTAFRAKHLKKNSNYSQF